MDGHALPAPPLEAGLHVVATPIGHLDDIGLRALKTLAAADLVLAEDTRHTGRLLRHFSITARLMPYHKHNATRQRPRILAMLRDNRALALVSDAGMPLISDPGGKLVAEAAAAGLPVRVIPGPSAVTAALAVSGLATERFLFAGFPPPKRAARRKWLAELTGVAATLILFESPHRIVDSLKDMAEVLGDRDAALCRELTKLHEEVRRAPLATLAANLGGRETVRGEITLVIAPPDGQPEASPEEIEAALKEALTDLPPARAAAQVAARFGLARRQVYELALKMKKA
ncbi:MAG TPA: 16S rRNA (cytidine(1402)-2'-O)-methyltransferase [Thermopetrobacter sp.]|nr:16S rRNA (cytidine(1402)-2'-O)-methyltransferase [Thermopetrobacter sp.]